MAMLRASSPPLLLKTKQMKTTKKTLKTIAFHWKLRSTKKTLKTIAFPWKLLSIFSPKPFLFDLCGVSVRQGGRPAGRGKTAKVIIIIISEMALLKRTKTGCKDGDHYRTKDDF